MVVASLPKTHNPRLPEKEIVSGGEAQVKGGEDAVATEGGRDMMPGMNSEQYTLAVDYMGDRDKDNACLIYAEEFRVRRLVLHLGI